MNARMFQVILSIASQKKSNRPFKPNRKHGIGSRPPESEYGCVLVGGGRDGCTGRGNFQLDRLSVIFGLNSGG